jgi:hypothetical protein
MLAIIDLMIDVENVMYILLVNFRLPHLLFVHSINTIIYGIVNRLNEVHSPNILPRSNLVIVYVVATIL